MKMGKEIYSTVSIHHHISCVFLYNIIDLIGFNIVSKTQKRSSEHLILSFNGVCVYINTFIVTINSTKRISNAKTYNSIVIWRNMYYFNLANLFKLLNNVNQNICNLNNSIFNFAIIILLCSSGSSSRLCIKIQQVIADCKNNLLKLSITNLFKNIINYTKKAFSRYICVILVASSGFTCPHSIM